MQEKMLFWFSAMLFTALLMALVMHLSLGPWRRSAGAHWTERARLLWQARRAQIVASFGIMFAVFMFWSVLFPRESGVGGLAFVIIGAVAGGYPAAREMEPRYTFRVWLNQTLWSLIMQAGQMGIFLWLVFTMPQELEARDWIRAGLGFVALALITTGVWIPWLNKFFPIKHPQQERLLRLVDEAVAISGTRPRHSWLAITPIANAMALPYIQSVVVTSRLMEELGDDEIRAILLHEMAHLREGLGVQAARLASHLSWVVLIFSHPVVHHFGGKGILVLFALIFGVRRLFNGLSHKLESHADAAAMQSGEDSVAYAHALETLYRANQMPAMMRGSTPHPHLYDRMLAAGVTPDYPRPLPPGRAAWPGWVALALPLIISAFLFLKARHGA